MPMKISERALFARVSRKLAHDNLFLHRCKEGSRLFYNLNCARYYCTDDRNSITGYSFRSTSELLDYGKELAVVRADEALDD